MPTIPHPRTHVNSPTRSSSRRAATLERKDVVAAGVPLPGARRGTAGYSAAKAPTRERSALAVHRQSNHGCPGCRCSTSISGRSRTADPRGSRRHRSRRATVLTRCQGTTSLRAEPASRVTAFGHKQRRRHRQSRTPARARRQVSPALFTSDVVFASLRSLAVIDGAKSAALAPRTWFPR